MQQFWSPYFYNQFEVFSLSHLAALAGLIITNLILFPLLKRSYSPRVDKIFRWTLGLVLLGGELALIVWFLAVGLWDTSYSLPLHLSRLAAILTGVALILDSRWLYQFLYFIDLGVAIPALLTPVLVYDFPHFGFFKFFISHGGLATSIAYFTLIKGYRPYLTSLVKTVIGINLLLPFIGLVNWLTDGNYFFLAEKPGTQTLMDYLGSWPWYILGLEAVGIVILVLLYLPYLIKDGQEDNSLSV